MAPINWTRGRIVGLSPHELSELPLVELGVIAGMLNQDPNGTRLELRARIVSAQVADLQAQRELPPCPMQCTLCRVFIAAS